MRNLIGRVAMSCGVVCSIALGCGGSSIDGDVGGAESDAATTDATLAGDAATISPRACIPGQSVACVGPGGCSSNQVCKSDGSGFGPCACAGAADSRAPLCVPGESIACAGVGGCSSHQVCNDTGSGYGTCDCPPPLDSGSPGPLCIPGHAVACAGPGGCISSQVCNAVGTGYGECVCEGDGGALSCVPGQSIACGGPYGCVSFQVCNPDGTTYGPCDCPEGGVRSYYDGGAPDGYAPLPPPVGNKGYNALWVETNSAYLAPLTRVLLLPLFSEPDCNVVPPYGESYGVTFLPVSAGPNGTYPACQDVKNQPPCYRVEPFLFPGLGDYETVPGGTFTLSAFDANGIATGQMNTSEGVVPLVVKNCQ